MKCFTVEGDHRRYVTGMTQYAFALRFRDANEAVLIPCSVTDAREVGRLAERVTRERPKAKFEGMVYYGPLPEPIQQ